MTASASAAAPYAAPARAPASLARTSLALLPFQAAFRAGEALLPVLLAAWFGRSAETDAFNLAWAFFTLLGSLVFGLFHDSALVPILVEARLRDPRSLPRLLGSVLAHSLVAAAGVAALVAGGALLWFRHQYLLVACFSARLVAVAIRTLFEAALQSAGWFRVAPVASAAGVAATAAVLAAAGARFGLAAAAPALLAGEVVALALVAAVAAGGAGLRPVLTFDRPEPVRRLARRALAEMAGRAVTRANPVVDQAMAAAAGVVGGGTLLRLSQDVGGLPTSLLQAALLPVLLARLSQEAAGGRLARHRRTTARVLGVVTCLLGAGAAALWVGRGPLMRLIFLHGAMDGAGVARMARILPFHLVGVVPFGLLLVLVRAHTSLGNSRIMFGVGLLNCGLNALFNVVLVRSLGLEGIALSTSTVSAVIAAVLWLRLPRAYPAAQGRSA